MSADEWFAQRGQREEYLHTLFDRAVDEGFTGTIEEFIDAIDGEETDGLQH